MSEFSVTVYMTPVGKGRPRMTKRGHVFTPLKTRQAENEFARYVRLKMGVTNQWQAFQGPIRANLEFGFIRPKSSKREYPTVNPDIDNLIKMVLDSCNGILYKDDVQVVSVTASKVYAAQAYIKLILTSVN